jgi:hypothetical protein
MFIRLTQATTITIALYILLGLNALQSSSVAAEPEPPEVFVALRQAVNRGLPLW